MHKSEPGVDPTLITHVDKVYEFRAGTIETYRNVGSLKIQF